MKRFWDKVDRRGPDECWEWKGSKWWNGYGIFCVTRNSRAKAHRISWILHNGPIPNGQIVMHTCDNPPCVNPDHLKTGTQRDNVRDRDSKGRHRPLRGEANGKTVLTRRDVRIIRSVTDLSQRYLGRVFGVSQTAISAVQRGKTHARS